MTETRYVITGKNADGLRTLSEPRQRRYTYDTQEIAEQKLKDIKENTSAETIKMCMGEELEVRPVECFVGGDPTTCWFNTFEETMSIMLTRKK